MRESRKGSGDAKRAISVWVKRIVSTATPASCHSCTCSILHYSHSWTDCRVCDPVEMPAIDLVNFNTIKTNEWTLRGYHVIALEACYNLSFDSEMIGRSVCPQTLQKADVAGAAICCHFESFLGFTAERFDWSNLTQKTLDRSLKQLSNGVHGIKINFQFFVEFRHFWWTMRIYHATARASASGRARTQPVNRGRRTTPKRRAWKTTNKENNHFRVILCVIESRTYIHLPEDDCWWEEFC